MGTSVMKKLFIWHVWQSKYTGYRVCFVKRNKLLLFLMTYHILFDVDITFNRAGVDIFNGS